MIHLVITARSSRCLTSFTELADRLGSIQPCTDTTAPSICMPRPSRFAVGVVDELAPASAGKRF